MTFLSIDPPKGPLHTGPLILYAKRDTRSVRSVHNNRGMTSKSKQAVKCAFKIVWQFICAASNTPKNDRQDPPYGPSLESKLVFPAEFIKSSDSTIVCGFLHMLMSCTELRVKPQKLAQKQRDF